MDSEKILKEKYNEVNIYDNFNPYRLSENVEPFMGGLPIIFMTTPSMRIFEDGSVPTTLLNANQLFSYLSDMDPFILKQLQYGNGGSNSPFIRILTNRFKGLSLKDFNMRTVDEYENYYGWKQILPSTTVDNFTAEASLNVNFAETKNLDITKIFYAWMSYIEAVRYGLHDPSDLNRDNRILDFTSSLYFFVLDFDMRTILYFCKYTGIYPINVPLGSLVMSDITSRNPIDTSITFVYQYKEELTPQIIYDFNSVSKYTSKIFSYTKNKTDTSVTMENLQTNYGYSKFERYNPSDDEEDISSSGKDGRDFLFKKDYTGVSIKIMSEDSYCSQSQTAFNSAENENKKSLILCFDNDNNKKSNPDNISYRNNFTNKYNSLAKDIKNQLLNNSKENSRGIISDVLENSDILGNNQLALKKLEKDYGIDDESVRDSKKKAKETLDTWKNKKILGLISEEEYATKVKEYNTEMNRIEENLKTNKEKYQAEVLAFDKYQFSSEFTTQKLKTMQTKEKEYNNVLKNDISERWLKYFGGFI